MAEGADLRIRPGSRLPPELLDLLTWPEECLAAEREFGHPCGRLFPLVGKTVQTPVGCGRLVAALPERAVVIAEGCYAAFLPGEVKPPRERGSKVPSTRRTPGW